MNLTECKEIIVPDNLDGERFDLTAATLFPSYSRSLLQKWIKQGSLRFEGLEKRSRDKVFAGGLITLESRKISPVQWLPEAIDIDVIAEDDTILVINKPAGMVVHPAPGHNDGTLVNALLNHAPQLSGIPRAGIVHRLDRDTTGLLVVAKSLESHNSLVSQIHDKTVERKYCAVCLGVMTGGGTISEPIGRHPRLRKKMTISSKGKSAITHYRIIRRFKHFTQISVQLETGRTHQIRAHMEHIRYPLLGDKMYCGRNKFVAGTPKALVKFLSTFNRQALHAEALSFQHPESRETLRFEAPIPDDFARLLDILNKEDSQKVDLVR